MRKGYNPIVAFAKDGMIAGLALGSDAVSEHEWGLGALLKKFCSRYVEFDALRDSYRKTGIRPVIDFRAERTLDKNLKHITAVEGEGTYTITTVNEHYSDLRGRVSLTGSLRDREEQEKTHRGQLLTEWDGSNFRFTNLLIGDEKLIKKLKVFFEQIQKGQVAFFSVHCGIFPKAGKLASGLVLVDTSRLNYAQSNYWKVMNSETLEKLELHRRSRIPQMSLDMFGDSSWGHTDIGYLWPMWQNPKLKEAVVYGLNPGFNVNADYFGPYTEGQIRRWVREKKSYRLKTSSPADEVQAVIQPAPFSQWISKLHREIPDLRVVMGEPPFAQDGVWFADIMRESERERSLTIQYLVREEMSFGVSRFSPDSLQMTPDLVFSNADASIPSIKRLFNPISL